MRCKVCEQSIIEFVPADGDKFSRSTIWVCGCGKRRGDLNGPPPMVCGGAKGDMCPEPFARGRIDAAQDCCENAPFNCVGGLEARAKLQAPKWICADHREAYLRGYEERARELYGDDWRTCAFGWAPALTIEAPTAAGETKGGGG